MLTLFTKYLLGFHIIVFFDGSTSHFQFDRYSLCVLKNLLFMLFRFIYVYLHIFCLSGRFLLVVFCFHPRLSCRWCFCGNYVAVCIQATNIATKHFVSSNNISAVNEIGFKVDNNKIFVYLTCRAYILIEHHIKPLCIFYLVWFLRLFSPSLSLSLCRLFSVVAFFPLLSCFFILFCVPK